ncbi:MAG: polyprenyl diphosphate synthase [Candidatus Nanoarchaeia archaeon]|nr:polyprenyl diphosphate synthase [Candidatus Nanoarchaeia archaeon]MDD5741127.1 polyprenyl diphosphate synthase [Candidatus Nanoarchaeia archaeon]
MSEQELTELKTEAKNPKHVGIILDGNRRFAKRLVMEPWKGHELGAGKVEKLIDWCKELGIREITLYCFSLENFNRPKKEFDFLMKIFKKEFSRLKQDKRVRDNKIKLKFIGKTELFDKELQKIIKELVEMTKDYDNYKVNFAFAYGGRQEILDAVKKLVENREEINEDNLKKNLWLESEPDLIIRTGGEKRTSNFLPWQSTYSEWIFLDKMWPEFEKQDLVDCVNEFRERERRFGE